MFRPRTSSTTAMNSAQNEIPSLLSPTSPRNRAIENDYTEHPATFRPASAPTVPSVLHREPRMHTERLLGRDSSRREARHHRSHSQDRHIGPSKHHRRHGDGATRSRRHCMPLPLPGQATRVSASATSLPSYYVSRERASNRLEGPTEPMLPPRSYPSTIGHLPPRRGSKPAAQLPIDMAVTSIPEDPGTPPERPPPPTVDDVSTRLRMHSVGTARTTQPRSRLASTASDQVVMSQPLQCMREGTPPVMPNNNVPRKDLIVDLKADKMTQTRTMSEKKHDKSNAASKPNSLKKNSEMEPMLRTEDSDHVLRPDDVEARGKPGDHNYPCPRCGKCTCLKCQGQTASSVVPQPTSHCWMCNHRCLCDVKSCIEYGTCICVARACFYHCTKYEDDEVTADKPCSCRGSDCCFRWTALGALSVVLPCLWCYPVASCCVKACKSCADCVKPGCRCKESYR